MKSFWVFILLLAGAAQAAERRVIIESLPPDGEVVALGMKVQKDSAGHVRIVRISSGSAAAAGLAVGDLLFSIEGKEIARALIPSIVARLDGKPGTSVTFVAGASTKVQRMFQLVRRSTDTATGIPARHHSFGGVGVRLKVKDRSILIEEVLPGSPAADAGLLAGSRLRAVDGKLLHGLAPADAALLIRGSQGSPVTFELPGRTVQMLRRTLVFDHSEQARKVRQPKTKTAAGILEECAKMLWKNCSCPGGCDADLCQEEWYLMGEDDAVCEFSVTDCFCSVCA